MQTYTDQSYTSGMEAPVSLQDFMDNMNSLKSSFSGAGSPSNTVSGMVWFDMSAGKAMKIRDKSNATWMGIMVADSGHKIWVYRNSAPEGWGIDSSVADVVLALKGGGGAFNVAGGSQAGSWVQPDGTISIAQMPSHNHPGGSHTHTVIVEVAGAPYNQTGLVTGIGNALSHPAYVDAAAPGTATQGGDGAHNHGSTYRPAAAVGCLMYMQI
jgi:hypothetical protein